MPDLLNAIAHTVLNNNNAISLYGTGAAPVLVEAGHR